MDVYSLNSQLKTYPDDGHRHGNALIVLALLQVRDTGGSNHQDAAPRPWQCNQLRRALVQVAGGPLAWRDILHANLCLAIRAS